MARECLLHSKKIAKYNPPLLAMPKLALPEVSEPLSLVAPTNFQGFFNRDCQRNRR